MQTEKKKVIPHMWKPAITPECCAFQQHIGSGAKHWQNLKATIKN